MFSKIKIALGIAVTAVVAFLAVLLNVRTNQRDKAVAKQEKTETERDVAIEVNEHNANIHEVQDAINKKRDEVQQLSNDDVASRMRSYDRARSNKD